MQRRSWHCRACGKKAFASQSIAENVIGQIHTRGGRKGGPSRAYECPHDNGWHLTSQEKRSA